MSLGWADTVVFTSGEDARTETIAAKTRITVGRLMVSFDLHDRLKSYLGAARGQQKIRESYIRLLEAGLDEVDRSKRTKELERQIQEMRRLVRAAMDIDLAPHARPPKVDPAWWAEREAERMGEAREALQTALTAVLEAKPQ